MTPIPSVLSRSTTGITVFALLITPALVLSAVYGLSYEPPSLEADAPRPEAHDRQLVAAAVEGCALALGLARVDVRDAAWIVRCSPGLGVGPVVGRVR